MSVKQVVESKYFKVGAIVGGVLLVALFSFAIGVKVGFYKASFSARFGENYERNFLGGDTRPMPPFGKMMNDGWGMRNPHGVGGEILSIAGDTLVIKNPENQESSLRVDDKTIINRGRQTLALSDLAIGENIIVVGRPGDDGVVVARLIRVFAR
ncbi:MAG: hypothetical protein KBD27_00715 [Candidatus Moranbacteria bacterium]|nr:hypothetical protein [Candidatus Moranbacteria bacterium]